MLELPEFLFLDIEDEYPTMISFTAVLGTIFLLTYLFRRTYSSKKHTTILEKEPEHSWISVNLKLQMQLISLKKELLAAGEELELAYSNADRLSSMLLEALDYIDVKIDFSEVGFWSVDLQTDELSLSENGLTIHGIPKGTKITLTEAFKMIDSLYQSEMAEAVQAAIGTGISYVRNYKMHPWDGSNAKYLKAFGKVIYNNHGVALTLSGSFLVVNS